MNIPENVTRRFRAIWSTELCYRFKKWQLLINELICSKCCRTNGSLFRNVVINGFGMSN